MLSQFGGNGDLISTILWFLIFIVFVILGPRLMITQTILKLERDVEKIEAISKETTTKLLNSLPKKSKKEVKNDVMNFMEFFAINPVSLDPYGIVKKIDMIVKQADDRFKYFVNQIAPDYSDENKANLKNGLEGAITTYQIAKVVRHYLETIKKYKMLQLAVLIQMQMPIIGRMAKAASKATDAFLKGLPIGDAAGPLVVASITPKNAKIEKYKEEEFILAEIPFDNRKVLVSKADGPGASTGYPGKFMKKIIEKYKIDRIITIDAAQKLEGEKTGSVAEGIGVAMGGIGTEKFDIEAIAVEKNIPLDAIVIKMDGEEALNPLPKDVYAAIPKAIEFLKSAVKRSKKDQKILIMGIGNSCGIGNTKETVEKLKNALKDEWKKAEEEKKKKPLFD